MSDASAPTCRACYAATLTPDERGRFNAEPPTTSVYLCPSHQASLDEVLRKFDFLLKAGPNEMFGQFGGQDQ